MQGKAIPSLSVRMDQIADYLPVVSTFLSLINIFQKCVLQAINEKNIQKNHYYQHLKQKSFKRCVILLIPFLGNIAVALYDFKKFIRKEEKDLKQVAFHFQPKTPFAEIHKIQVKENPIFIQLKNEKNVESNMVQENVKIEPLPNVNILELLNQKIPQSIDYGKTKKIDVFVKEAHAHEKEDDRVLEVQPEDVSGLFEEIPVEKKILTVEVENKDVLLIEKKEDFG